MRASLRRSRSVLCAAGLAALLGVGAGASIVGVAPLRTRAESATPAATGCIVEPRSTDDLTALEATAAAVASPAPPQPVDIPAQGAPVDEQTLSAIIDTLAQATACAEAGDVGRMLALYTDRYVVENALRPEPVLIVPGQPPVSATPASNADATPGAVAAPRILSAVLLENGDVAAIIANDDSGGIDIGDGTSGGDAVIFHDEGGRWRIDAVGPAAPGATPVATLPAPVQAALNAAAAEFGTGPEGLRVERVEPMDWPDASLGCPKPGEFYAQVITPGFIVTISVGADTHTYHTDSSSHAIRCDP